MAALSLLCIALWLMWLVTGFEGLELLRKSETNTAQSFELQRAFYQLSNQQDVAAFYAGEWLLLMKWTGREKWTDWPQDVRQLVRTHIITWKA
eukprot:4507742-Amphidinium_carterae.2